MQQQDPMKTQSPFTGLTRAQRQHFVIITSQTSLVIGVVLGALYAILYVATPSWKLAISAAQALPTTLVTLLTIRLARNDQTTLGTYILLPYILALTALISISLGLLPAIAPVYMTFIAVGGMVFGPVGGYAIAGIASVLWLVSFFLVGLDLPAGTPLSGGTAQFVLVTLTLTPFWLTAYLSRAATNHLWRALDDAAYDLVNANRQLDEASKQKSRFLARMSHDLRTPLAAIKLSNDLLLRGIYGSINEKQQRAVIRSVNSTQRLQALINDILDISKIEAGQLELIEGPVAAVSLAESLQTFRQKAREKGICFKVNVSPGLPPYLKGDENRLGQILANLVENAIKFTDEGEIDIRMGEVDGAHWYISVRDTGRGIRESDLSLIFDEFRQSIHSSNDTVHGTGLGLAITRHLVNLMQGSIRVESELGKGSLFEVILPLVAIEEQSDGV